MKFLLIIAVLFLAWLVLMVMYWVHGRHAKTAVFPCGHPRRVCGVEALDCPICHSKNPVVVGNLMGRSANNELDALVMRILDDKSVCRCCGKVIGFGQDTCSECYGDTSHG